MMHARAGHPENAARLLPASWPAGWRRVPTAGSGNGPSTEAPYGLPPRGPFGVPPGKEEPVPDDGGGAAPSPEPEGPDSVPDPEEGPAGGGEDAG